MEAGLAAVYRAHAKEGRALTNAEILAAIDACKRVHPRLRIADEELVAHVASHAGPKPSAWEDLYLALACARGDSHALAALEMILHDLLRTKNVQSFERDDALATLRRDLCTGESPRILQYSGQGPLKAWLTVSATRAFLKVKRAVRHDADDDSALLAERAPGGDPELQYLKAKYRESFREAVAEAITHLPPKSALILKQSVVDGLSIDALASLHGTHRATCARWISQAKGELLALVRIRFGERARVSGEELESVLRLIESNFDASVKRHLVRVTK